MRAHLVCLAGYAFVYVYIGSPPALVWSNLRLLLEIGVLNNARVVHVPRHVCVSARHDVYNSSVPTEMVW